MLHIHNHINKLPITTSPEYVENPGKTTKNRRKFERYFAPHAYLCKCRYHAARPTEAIIFASQKRMDIAATADAMRFLSRLKQLAKAFLRPLH
jgi:hypothetical protein